MTDALATITPALPLADFCTAFLSRHKEHWPPDEGTLAREFVRQFQPGLLSRREDVILFADRLGIKVSLNALPDLHGMNFSTEKATLILLNEPEAVPGSREHTFFHELREVMEFCFRDQGVPTVEGRELERHAEQFAMFARMESYTQAIGQLTDGAKEIQQVWKRWLAFGGLFLLFVGAGLSCALLPHLEKDLRSK